MLTKTPYPGQSTLLALAVALSPGCKSKSGEGAEGKSTSEVKAEQAGLSLREVCELRQKEWKRAIYRDCTTCQSLAAAPKCGTCNEKPFAGQCAKLNAALIADESCDEARMCKMKCKRDDCACIASCFEGQPSCEKMAAAVDACTTEQCASLCE